MAKVCRLIYGQLFSNPPIGIAVQTFVHESAVIEDGVSIGPFCYIGKGVRVGKNTFIESHCHIGENVSIGEHCRLYPNVKLLANCQIGNGVLLNSGVVVGSEGYGFEQVGSSHEKIPHLGKVIIEDDVEVGANTCIDRARLEETRIGEGTKIDNLVQIGHNVRIGKGCLIVAQVGIAGSVVFEDGVVVGGQAGFAGHLKIGKGAKIAGQAGITKNVEPGAFLRATPHYLCSWHTKSRFYKENYQIYSKGLPKTRTLSNPLIMDRTSSSIKIFSGTSNLPLAQEICSYLNVPLRRLSNGFS